MRLRNGDNINVIGDDREIIKLLVEKEVLYYDPINDRITFHTKLHERAIEDLLKNDQL